jgi:hypothetical protein
MQGQNRRDPHKKFLRWRRSKFKDGGDQNLTTAASTRVCFFFFMDRHKRRALAPKKKTLKTVFDFVSSFVEDVALLLPAAAAEDVEVRRPVELGAEARLMQGLAVGAGAAVARETRFSRQIFFRRKLFDLGSISRNRFGRNLRKKSNLVHYIVILTPFGSIKYLKNF